MDNKYNNGKIYKIVDVGYNLCYIGSTTEELSQRMARHRYHYKYFTEGKKQNFITIFKIFEQFGVEHCKIELVELYPCNSRMELEKREGEIIRETECINKVVVGRTRHEHYVANRPAILIKCQQYRQEHSEDIHQKLRTY